MFEPTPSWPMLTDDRVCLGSESADVESWRERIPRWSSVGVPAPNRPATDRRAAREQGHREGRPTVVAQRGELWVLRRSAVPTWLPWLPSLIPVMPDPSPTRLYSAAALHRACDVAAGLLTSDDRVIQSQHCEAS